MRSARQMVLGCVLLLLIGCSGTPDPMDAAPCVAGGDLGERVSFEGLSFQVPSRWASVLPSSAMRRAQYQVPRADGDAEDGECALFVFPGTGGSVDANLQRWYGQMIQPDGGSAADRARVDRFDANGLRVTLVAVSGTYSGGMGGGGPKPEFRMVAGIVETGDRWFLKCTGPEATMQVAETEVCALLGTVAP